MQKIISYFIITLFVFISSIRSQTFEKQIGEQQWHLIKTLDGVLAGHNDETFALYEIPKESFGILLINIKGQIKWKTTIKEKPFYIGKLDNKIIVLTGENNINAVLIDPETGKIALQRTIINSIASNVLSPKIYSSETGKFLKIGLRYASDSKGARVSPFRIAAGQPYDFANQIIKAEVWSFDKNLELNNTQILHFPTSTLLDGGSSMDPEGNIIFAAYNKDNDEVIVYRFPDGKALPDKQMKISLTIKKLELIRDMQLLASKQQSSIAYFITHYRNEDKDYVYEIQRMDFATGVKTGVSDILNKKYRKELESELDKSYKGIRKPDLDDLENLMLTNIIEADGKVLVCKDTRHTETTMSNTLMFVGGNGIISVYSNDMKKMYEHIIPKKYKSYLPFGLGLNLHVKEGTVYVVANDSEGGYMKAEVLFGKIDISSGSVISIEHLVKDAIGVAEPADTQNLIWFKDKIIVNYMKLKGLFSGSYTNIPSIYKY